MSRGVTDVRRVYSIRRATRRMVGVGAGGRREERKDMCLLVDVGRGRERGGALRKSSGHRKGECPLHLQRYQGLQTPATHAANPHNQPTLERSKAADTPVPPLPMPANPHYHPTWVRSR